MSYTVKPANVYATVLAMNIVRGLLVKICLFNAVEQDIRETIFLSDPLHTGCSGCTRSTYDIITKIQLSSNLKIYIIHSLKIMCS